MLVSIKNHLTIVVTCLVLCACNLSLVKPHSQPDPETVETRYIKPDNNQTHAAESPAQEASAPTQTAVDQDDLWQRIAQHSTFNTHSDEQRVQSKLQWYQRNQNHLDRIVERATPYLYFIVEEIDRRQLPVELSLIPIIESAFQANAVSPMKASGIWQFMPATGKQFGLKRNSWYDGRRDIVASTRAALKYLHQLNESFDGDWLLTMAAYNAGPATIDRARKKNAGRGKPTDFWSLELHRETRHYVPAVLAIAEIVRQPERYQLSLQQIPNRPYFMAVDTQGQIDLNKVAAISNVDIDTIKRLNPGFRGNITDPDGPHKILLPVGIDAQVADKLASIPPQERVTVRRHTIRDGETLSHIAERYHTSVYALKRMNGLSSHRIRAGKSLLIPLTADGNASFEQTVAADHLIHRVRRGDTLWDIGRAYRVSINDLCDWNSIRPNSTLSLGQSLLIKQTSAKNSSQMVKTARQSHHRSKPLRYKIRSGDSLWLIARRFNVTVRELQEWNKLQHNSLLQPGQSIVVYAREKPTGV